MNENGEIAAEANGVLVMFSFSEDKKIQFPEDLRKKIGDLEGRNY